MGRREIAAIVLMGAVVAAFWILGHGPSRFAGFAVLARGLWWAINRE